MKKALKLVRDPRGFVADAAPVRKLFGNLYPDQVPRLQSDADQGSGPPAVSPLNPCVLYEGVAWTCSSVIADFVKYMIDAVALDCPIVVFPTSTPNTVHVGILRSHFHYLYTALSRDSRIKWAADPKPRSSATLRNISGLASANRISAAFELLQGTNVRFLISIYTLQSENGHKIFLTPNNENKVARKIEGALGEVLFSSTGVKLYQSVVGNPVLYHVRFPIDVVYTWVNHEDPDWQAAYGEHAVAHGRKSDASALSRFLSRDELKYSIRSVYQYLPWVRRIHILTNCSPPPWFREHENVRWVDHKDVLDPRVLPTFSSHAIETSLHRIPGLAEHFLYLNDDFFLNKPASPELFFEPSGIGRSKLEPYGVVNGKFKPGDPDYLNAARLGADLIAEKYGVRPTQLHEHAPYALRVSVLAEMEQAYSDHFGTTRANRFRARGDISVASFLYHHYARLTGAGIGAAYTSKLIKSTSGNLARTLASLKENGGPVTFCLNDGNDSHEDGIWDMEVRRFLGSRFPHPAPCELFTEQSDEVSGEWDEENPTQDGDLES